MSDPAKSSRSRQATSGGVAMAVAVVISWGASQAGFEVPGEITAALATIIGFAAAKIGG